MALVTGGARGIGRSIALALADAGANIIVNYSSSEKAAEEVAGLIRSKGRVAMTAKANVAFPDQVEEMKKEVLTRFKMIDILVNNSGITRDKSFSKMEEKMWREVLSVNLDGAYYCTKSFIDGMVERGSGRVVNIASIVGQMGNFGQANYAASKGGLIAFSKTIAREYAKKGITVNVVAPGFTETEMVMAIPSEVKEKIYTQIPMGRFAKPEEVAACVVFLCSPGAAYITGHVLAINGGQYM
ncbi:3-oxoacyl-[acyl-carrier-protein] reductase [bacterium]|nr:3-oxoacyl-[acyl-carrier-protein] reductase [bacterium]